MNKQASKYIVCQRVESAIEIKKAKGTRDEDFRRFYFISCFFRGHFFSNLWGIWAILSSAL